jgi:GT2 family glycosyltransferase
MLSRVKTIGTVGYMGGIMSLPEPFVWSLTQMIQFNREALCQEDEKIDYVRAQVSLHSAARNELMGKMKGEWLLQLDTDMVFDPDFCARLVTTMQKYNLDILTGLYVYKNHPQIPTVYMFNEKNGRHEPIGSWDESMDVFEISSSGGGCLLIRRSVFERIIAEIQQNPFEIIPPYGEDHSFFMRARKLGIKAHCAWKIQAAHLGYKQVVHLPDPGLPFLNQYAVTGYGTRKGE